jgi:hypothetical protein
MDRHIDPVAMARQVFVHGIVEHLRDAMMQGAFVGPSDVHAGLLPNRLQSFKLAQLGRIV